MNRLYDFFYKIPTLLKPTFGIIPTLFIILYKREANSHVVIPWTVAHFCVEGYSGINLKDYGL